MRRLPIRFRSPKPKLTTPPKLTTDGRALLMKALRAIKRHPKQFGHPCRTTMCLAGWIVQEAGFPVTSYHLDPNTGPLNLRGIIRRITDYPTIPRLASHLVVGRSSDRRDDMELALFYGSERTPLQIERRVREWLRTGK